MIRLTPHNGIPRQVLLMMAVMAGFTVANLYYNQPLLDLICRETGITQVEANLITVVTQIGYALGLLFVVPLADMVSVRRIVVVGMSVASDSAVTIGLAGNVWASGLITGIVSARAVSGYVGDWLGWRWMFFIVAFLMLVGLLVSLRMMPQVTLTFKGTYRQLMQTVGSIFMSHPRIRLYSLRPAMSFASMMSIWSCMAFHLAGPPFHAGSDAVGMLALCGVAGAIAASGAGKYVPRVGIFRMSIIGGCLQLMAWVSAWLFGDTYTGLVASIILADIGAQCLQVSNQSGSLQQLPQATNRVNTIFMTIFFIGGSLGTFFSGLGWSMAGWLGVCIVGGFFASATLLLSAYEQLFMKQQNEKE